MARKIFVNLPVRDLRKSMDFFGKLGFTFNAQFTDEADATKSTEVLVCLSSASRSEVDEMVRKAVAAGGKTYKEPEDHGFMYGNGFQDLDGHIWELAFMEPSAAKSA